jgi:hypothetical protein
VAWWDWAPASGRCLGRESGAGVPAAVCPLIEKVKKAGETPFVPQGRPALRNPAGRCRLGVAGCGTLSGHARDKI